MIPHCLILAGGRSSRMGADKALVPLAGIPMLHRVAQTARELSPELHILGRTAPPGFPFAATFLPDDAPAAGPMPALRAALARLGTPILLLACDMPLLTVGTLHLLLAHHRPESPATLTLSSSDFLLPAPSIFTPAILPHMDRAIAKHKGSFQPLRPHVRLWSPPRELEPQFQNLNTPEALARAEASLKKTGPHQS